MAAVAKSAEIVCVFEREIRMLITALNSNPPSSDYQR